MICVYTCILGGFDNLRPPLVPPEPGVRFICFTDVPVLPDVPPWEFRPVHQVFDAIEHDDGIGSCYEVNAARTSRLPKILPHLILPAGCDHSIWLDGSFQLLKPASEIVNAELRRDDWAAHRHPVRGCMYEEAALLAKLKIELPEQWPMLDADRLGAEVARYEAMGFPRGLVTLNANGVIIRRHTEAVNALNERWWKLFVGGCLRDQLSFPVALWQNEIPINRMPHYPDIYSSPLVRFGWHAAWKNKPDNVLYRPERERIAARVENLREVAGDGGYEWLIP